MIVFLGRDQGARAGEIKPGRCVAKRGVKRKAERLGDPRAARCWGPGKPMTPQGQKSYFSLMPQSHHLYLLARRLISFCPLKQAAVKLFH